MKKIFGLTLIAMMAMVLVGCDDGTANVVETTLKIQNESFSDLTNVIWNNVSFGNIGRGQSVTQTVQSGQGFIRFRRATSPLNARTNQAVVINSGEFAEFVITNNTLITDEQNTSETGTLGTLNMPEPQIAILQGNVTITQQGEVDFDTVYGSSLFAGTTWDITFTIRNTGQADLTFNPIGGNVINLTDNASGFFTVIRQPAINARVTRGNSTTFTIRFSPLVEGDNFNATVQVSTNSQINADFSFRVCGSSWEYKPQMLIRQNNTTINQNGEFDFGTVAVDTTRDITFTIGNNGLADLTFNAVGGNVINLTDNAAGVFTVIQQPAITTRVSRENTTTFVLRFSPMSEGNNFDATVRISTNCPNNADFYFRVQGNGYVRKPQITIRQGNTAIGQSSEYDFGAVLTGNNSDVTFTIENSGEAALIFESINGNRINLLDNAGNHFVVVQQPPETQVIAPGSTTSFVIRFSPTTIGQNYTANVQIRTNSENNSVFSFWIKGLCRNYIVGDTGPAGGIIFYDAGSIMNGWRYFEAALTDFSAQWGAASVNVADTGTAVGTGKQNTQLIINVLNQLGETGKAAQLCANLTFGEINDWFLPSRDELGLMYTNLKQNGLGDFGNGRYWSSSQNSSVSVWSQSFYDGNRASYDGKVAIYSVRAVRSFTLE